MTGQPVLEAMQAALATAPDPEPLRADSRVWVGFSGGLDSSVVLDAAVAVAAPRLGVVHVNHQIHSDSGLWAEHCRRVCAAYGVDCHSRTVGISGSGNLEQRARDARYDVFESVVSEGDRLLLGHHADDQGETMLFRLLRGTGARPGGMRDQRRLGRGWLLRPLLGLPRTTLEHYAKARGLEWLDDSSNWDESFDRNFLRRRVLPRLRERWPDAATALTRAARFQARDAALLDHLLDEQLEHMDEEGCLSWRRLRSFPQPERLLRHWLEHAGVHGIRARALAEFLRQLESGATAPELRLDERLALRAFKELLYLVSDLPRPQPFKRYVRLHAETQPSDLGLAHGRLEFHRAAQAGPGLKAGDYEVRPRQGGERLRSHPRQSRSVKRLLAESCVPPWLRPDYPLIWAGAEVAAVPGVGVAAGFRDDGGWGLVWHPAGVVRGSC